MRKHLEMLIRNEVTYVTPKLGSLADSGELVYHLAVTGRIGLGELRRVLADAVLVSETQEPQMKYLLCRANDLVDVNSKIGMVSKLPGMESVMVTLNRELLVGTEFVHRLVREKVRDWENRRRGQFATESRNV